jgi:hypothetical protein
MKSSWHLKPYSLPPKWEDFVLMHQEDEVLSFSVCFDNSAIHVKEKLAHFDKAPYGMNEEGASLDTILRSFFYRRTIPNVRYGFKEILKATGCKDAFSLSFQGHGLSLSNHYWYKRAGEKVLYKDINFFENPWDDSFGRALLKGDFAALSHCDLNVPDVVTPGWATKGWLYEDGPKLYKIGIDPEHSEEALGEVLSSRCIRQMLGEDAALTYDLGFFEGKYVSISKPIINMDQDLVHLSQVLPHSLRELAFEKSVDRNAAKRFYELLAEYGMPNLYQHFVKLSCIRALCFLPDLHFDNVALLHNFKTGDYSPAPFFDLAGSFGGTVRGKKILADLNKGTYFIVYFLFGGLDPDWDYSWYDPKRLDGFENEIRDVLSKSDFYNEKLIDNIIDVYHVQKEELEKNALAQKEKTAV